MNILALETSTALLSVALRCDGKVLVRSERLANGGSDRLLPWVRALLDEAGLSLNQLDGIAFGSGPGGFTGIRLSCGVAQGLAFGADLPVIGVCGLEAMAVDVGVERVYVCLDARMNEVYTAAYEVRDGVPVAVLAPAVTPPDQAPLPPDGLWLCAGDGFTSYTDALNQRLAGRIERINADSLPTAAAVARLAEARFARGEGRSAAEAQPLYVREKVALTTAERLARGGVR
ncbi:MAG TPA: tRNA (adenosine(37)-N6)-threonylcarbamoyltransferase complex dimerization subunit type 1 TsaB [Rhodocyclaceae bacterium]|nr:tRNA (adenosine(37)-N6)-threonylcarbamoyltransferase complex dimerization subunit type 1 TsaB [Rhodocyclaceae bacterium]